MILPYLLKSTLCLAILFGFYKLVLEPKAMHQFKRFYLLASLIFAFTIPLITFTYTTEVPEEEIWIQDFAQAYEVSTQEIQMPHETPEKEDTNVILWSIYGLGVLLFGVRFGLNLFRLKRKIYAAKTIEEPDFTLALMSQAVIPHSFLWWIFLSRKQYEHQEIAPEVLAHEATHVREKHTIDILFIELLQVVFWFNPMVWLAKTSIKLNHEFLADQGALREQKDITHYQNILLSYASSTHHTVLESPFNYSLTKKRIVMLSQSFSKKRVVLRALLLVPVLVGCGLLFNQAIVAQEKERKEIPIIGEWITETAEMPFVNIYEENDSLWCAIGKDKFLMLEDNKGYYLKTGVENKLKHYVAVNMDGSLKFGDYGYKIIPASRGVKQSLLGTWKKENSGEEIVNFVLNNGGLICHIVTSDQKSTRYYPKLKDGGVTFTMGNKWVSFKRKGEVLIDGDGNRYIQQEIRIPKGVTAQKYLDLWQDTNEYKLFLDEQPIANADILNYKPEELPHYETKFENGQTVVSIWTQPFYEKMSKIGYSAFSDTDFSRVPVVVVEENTVTINGKKSSTETYVEDMNSVTAGWTQKEMRQAFPGQFITKNADPELLEALDEQLRKTDYWKANISHSAQIMKDVIIYSKKPILISINNDEISINGKLSSLANLRKDIDAITEDWTPTEYRKTPVSTFMTKGNTPSFLQKAEAEFQKTKLAQANDGIKLVPPPPASPSPGSEDFLPPPPPPQKSYANEFIQGAAQNGKKALVIQILNDQIKINGHQSSLSKLREDIDAITRDWEEEDYKDAVPSFLVKNGGSSFLEIANEEFLKTHFSRANGGMKLVPPPPPAPPAPGAPLPPPPPPPPSPLKYLQKMNELGGKFYQEEKEISYEKAVAILKANKNLNIQTPVPYSNPPKTYITEYPMLGSYNSIHSAKDNFRRDKKIGDTVVYSDGYDQKFLMVKDSDNGGRTIVKRPKDAGVDKVQLDTYNKLARKYNKQPKATRKIPAGELKVIEDIYRNMNTTQKIKNEPFPECEIKSTEKGSGFSDNAQGTGDFKLDDRPSSSLALGGSNYAPRIEIGEIKIKTRLLGKAENDVKVSPFNKTYFSSQKSTYKKLE
ncbi:M56 family metallopeptidase [Dokdonia sinensis]|uniref:M56 family metallopeptidase n=1 Tax=Dokdonia sinensis TaxID=2479847 RepID=A0A3M0GD75_9FLAO|nr:M56 family metallopeptidase [Dokdonia sinensis]RMB59079.1 M56 family metallopeptidase [Dokdonia sinensis]